MQNGNVFIALLGALVLIGLLGSAAMSVLRGPVAGMARVTEQTIAKNDMIAAMTLISEKTLAQPGADCDADGMVEPIAYRTGASNVPTGGGLLPSELGMSYQDPWKREYGYCAWDHGSKKRSDNVAACGGNSAARLNGVNAAKETAIAIVSSGPNGVFETTCREWADGNNDQIADLPLVEGAGESDDIVRVIPYGQFMMPASAKAKLEALPDAACMSTSVGLMRIVLGVVQVCTEGGWAEIAPASGGDISFVPVTNAVVGSSHQSNIITVGTLSAPVSVSISGGATLSINGGGPATSGTLSSGSTLRLSGSAGSAPETTRTYVVQIGAITKIWTITTRDAYVGNLSITPTLKDGMTVTGPGSPAYGATTGFVVSNTGERPTGVLGSAALSNTTNFAFNTGGGYVGDNCAGKVLQGTLAGAQSCVIDVRAKASNDSAGYQGTLSISDGMLSVSATLSGSASGWSCNLPWGGKIANGASMVAYLTSCSLLSCTSQSRVCTNGVLSGSYQHQTCNVLLSCL